MKRIKAGKGFWQSGYGRGFNKNAIIYQINGKYYAKSSKNAYTAMDGDLLEKGYVCVNRFTSVANGNYEFWQCSLREHKTV